MDKSVNPLSELVERIKEHIKDAEMYLGYAKSLLKLVEDNYCDEQPKKR